MKHIKHPSFRYTQCNQHIHKPQWFSTQFAAAQWGLSQAQSTAQRNKSIIKHEVYVALHAFQKSAHSLEIGKVQLHYTQWHKGSFLSTVLLKLCSLNKQRKEIWVRTFSDEDAEPKSQTKDSKLLKYY